ncbi:MAG TPA: TA system VapC family ribonuclease toxin [Bryobacteraceae bacterium]|jgi:toxin-antitoxin system PIN domain toxin|nr:TA system VapC family ribonuclease toxin [Bryobacteraceae bacterium]
MSDLLDVNALIALVDADHIHHQRMRRWFDEHAHDGWATCPITENGFIRVVSNAKYPSGQRTSAELVGTLRDLKTAGVEAYQFWPDDITFTDNALFRPEYLVRSGHVTDAYLLGLAAKHGGRLVSFDGSLPWQAIRGASSSLVERPA